MEQVNEAETQATESTLSCASPCPLLHLPLSKHQLETTKNTCMTLASKQHLRDNAGVDIDLVCS